MQRIKGTYSKNTIKPNLQLLVESDKKNDSHQEKDKENGNLRAYIDKRLNILKI